MSWVMHWTRIMVRTSDRGVLDNETVTKESGRDVADNGKVCIKI